MQPPPSSASATSHSSTKGHGHGGSAIPRMMHQLVSLVNDILAEVKREHDGAMEGVRQEWAVISAEKEGIALERANLDREKKAFLEDVERERDRLGSLLAHGAVARQSGPQTPNRVPTATATATASSTPPPQSRTTPSRRISATQLNTQDVFSRLTDRSSYTGVQQHASPNAHSTAVGYSPRRNASPTSTHAKNFNVAPVRKFGLQTEGPFWITVWPGLQRQGGPTKVLMQNCRTMAQLLEKVCRDTRVQPQPSVLYTPDGRAISSLNDIRPGLDYLVVPSGTTYREDSVPTALLQKLVTEGEQISEAVSQMQWSYRHNAAHNTSALQQQQQPPQRREQQQCHADATTTVGQQIAGGVSPTSVAVENPYAIEDNEQS
eukprot:PhM_4_TR15971/c1_g1_i1/m.98034